VPPPIPTTSTRERLADASPLSERLAEAERSLAALRDLTAHLETQRELERSRIAGAIHDELGSLLVALKLDLNWLAKRLEGREPLLRKCEDMGQTIDGAVARLGRIVTELHPSILDHQGLWAALEWQVQEFIDASALPTELRFHVAAGVPPLEGAVGERWSIAVFRIVQGVLANVSAHARAKAVWIQLYVDDPPEPMLHMEVRDDGIGAPPAVIRHGHGVLAMVERAAAFGGALVVDSAPGQGTRVRLTMPLPGDGDGGAAGGARR
jgi:signal transduction histidine kinase